MEKRTIGAICSVVYLVSGFLLSAIHFGFLFLVILGGLGLFISLCVYRIPWGETWIIDRRGQLIQRRPGYQVIFPYFQWNIIRKKVKTIEYSITLFPREDYWLPTANGGQVKLIEPKVWIKVKNPRKVAEVEDYEILVREMAEHRIAGLINTLTEKEIDQMRAGEERGQRITEWLRRERDGAMTGFIKTLQSLEIEFKGFTLSDFDYSKEVQAQRTELYKAGVNVRIAEKEAERRELEIGEAIGKAAEKLIEDYDFPPEIAQQTAIERHGDLVAGEKGELKRIIWKGGSTSIAEIVNETMTALELFKKKKKNKKESSESIGEAFLQMSEEERKKFFGL